MKVLILGADGYLGYSLLKSLKHQVIGVDNGVRRKMVEEVGSDSLVPIQSMEERGIIQVELTDYIQVETLIRETNPDVIIHLAEQPSAPYSMIDAQHATFSQSNNIIGTLNVLWAVKNINPKIHIIKLGTAGEYPDWLYNGMTIPEGTRVKVKYQKKDWEIPVPRYAGSFYHFSKVFDSLNIDYANRIWGLNITDINQGVVYGHREGTRFDYDECFGTVVNRFAVQKLAGVPLTVYGTGGQTRGYIHIDNVMQAIELLIANPPKGYRIIHQMTEEKSVLDIAKLFDHEIKNYPNPRCEMAENQFKFERKKLTDFGLNPIKMESKIGELLQSLAPYQDRIIREVIEPKTQWQKS